MKHLNPPLMEWPTSSKDMPFSLPKPGSSRKGMKMNEIRNCHIQSQLKSGLSVGWSPGRWRPTG